MSNEDILKSRKLFESAISNKKPAVKKCALNEHEESLTIIKKAIPSLERFYSKLLGNVTIKFGDIRTWSKTSYKLESTPIDSQDLGVFAHFMKDATIYLEFREYTDEQCYLIRMGISYNHFGGGSNGKSYEGDPVVLTFDGKLLSFDEFQNRKGK